MSSTSPEQIAALIRDGRKIEAVKAIREETGVSLREALRAVEAMETPEDTEAPEMRETIGSGISPSAAMTLVGIAAAVLAALAAFLL